MERTIENVKKLIIEGKSIREIANIFNVTYTPMRVWMKRRDLTTFYKKQKLTTKTKQLNVEMCKYCKKDFLYDRMKGHRHSVCNSCNVSKSRRRLKQKSVEYKGGECKICKYNKCITALSFHHLDPTKKDFGISHKGRIRSWKKTKKELDKCILLCHNCHSEVHAGIINLDNLG